MRNDSGPRTEEAARRSQGSWRAVIGSEHGRRTRGRKRSRRRGVPAIPAERGDIRTLSALLHPETITASATAWSKSTNWIIPRCVSASSLDMRTPHPSSLWPLWR